MRIYFFPAGAEIEKLHSPRTIRHLRGFRCQHLTSFELKLNLMKLYDPGSNELCRSQVAKVQNMKGETFNHRRTFPRSPFQPRNEKWDCRIASRLGEIPNCDFAAVLLFKFCKRSSSFYFLIVSRALCTFTSRCSFNDSWGGFYGFSQEWLFSWMRRVFYRQFLRKRIWQLMNDNVCLSAFLDPALFIGKTLNFSKIIFFLQICDKIMWRPSEDVSWQSSIIYDFRCWF